MDEKEVQTTINKAIKTYDMKRNNSDILTSSYDLYDFVNISFGVTSATIATTGSTHAYFIVPQVSQTATVGEVNFSGVDVLATSNTNYITWTITNLGQAGSGTAVMLSAVDANTTKATGGSALAANTKRTMTLTTAAKDLNVSTGDRIKITAIATGTLANTVTFPVYLIQLTQ